MATGGSKHHLFLINPNLPTKPMKIEIQDKQGNTSSFLVDGHQDALYEMQNLTLIKHYVDEYDQPVWVYLIKEKHSASSNLPTK